jgi:hypothetical protein
MPFYYCFINYIIPTVSNGNITIYYELLTQLDVLFVLAFQNRKFKYHKQINNYN